MSVLLYLIPAALLLGLLGLVAFLWAMRSDQFSDLDGAAERILYDDDKPRAADNRLVRHIPVSSGHRGTHGQGLPAPRLLSGRSRRRRLKRRGRAR